MTMEQIGDIAARVVANADPYAYWNKALALGGGRQLTREQSKSLNITTEPKCGFYRKRNKDGADIPVAIWVDDSGFVAKAGERMVDPDDIWTWVCSWPISHETYETIMAGGAWADDAPVADPVIGHNLPDDPHEAAKIEFAGEKELAEEFLKKPVTTQAQADQAAVWAKKLSDLHSKVDKMFRAEKDPIVVAGREVDEKYRWREEPKALSTKLKRAQDDFLREQDRLEQERQRKAREEADRVRREAEEAARKAAESDQQSAKEREAAKAEAERLAAEAAAKEREAQAQKVSAGRTGARTSLRTYVSARIIDYDKAVVALKDHPDMRSLVEQLANRAVKAGVPVAGIERVEEKRAA